MAYRRRIYFTDQQKAEIWDRWQRGESMSSIGRLFDRNSSSIYPLLARTGGIRPPERRRSRLAMTLAEREEISRGLKAKLSFRSIARQLRRAPSTISREVRRNGGRRVYRAASADLAAWDRAKRPKPCKLVGQPQTLVTSRSSFRERQRVTLVDRGETNTVLLARQVAATASYSQYEFQFIKELGDVLTGEQRNPLDTPYDSVWSNI